ncbi:MAG: DUF3788 domain-containing protein [Rhodoferax sp.]|uniref:DUF3788 domain-containing protein n=1 Tax=Rhodoferax sp. TaxID=50421 RepID=UPI00272469AA|nr:DUF3788 domain-containing protein [Rhodoferax sp.]MDO8450556.1 DUF3788 domain-containing protein [Rhodoferax sp.]
MSDSPNRMTEPGNAPTASAVADWVGNDAYKYWEKITQLIEQNYPGVFTPEWLYGGKKHGWSLRYKKSKSFCTLVPEKKRLALLIVFGAEDREKVESLRKGLAKKTQNEYDQATTYHDGKWLLLEIDTDSVVKDAMLLLAAKRRPKNGKKA